MSTFGAEQIKTSGKMSDLVMEYVSQFIARDLLEIYERFNQTENEEFVSAEFDDKIYKKIAKRIRKNTGQNIKTLRFILSVAVAVICVSCVIFTLAVLLHSTLRNEIFYAISSFVNKS